MQLSMAQQITRCPATEPPLVEDSGESSQLSRTDDSISVGGALKAEEMERKSRSSKLLADELHDENKLSSLLVSAYVRRQEFRGSDVRLDISALYRHDSFPRGRSSPTVGCGTGRTLSPSRRKITSTCWSSEPWCILLSGGFEIKPSGAAGRCTSLTARWPWR